MMASPTDNIYESKASYYNTETKTWKTGTFTLTEKCFSFHGDDGSGLSRNLKDISGIEKRQSSFVFAALVISIGSDQHWFASFHSRDEVYNVVELFWRESLLARPHWSTSPQSRRPDSNLGKELLGILQESESTLVEAANALSQQGRQIEESQSTVEDINVDLDAAERFLRGTKIASAIFQRQDSQAVGSPVKHFNIVFSTQNSSSAAQSSKEKGTLVIKSDEVCVLDDQKNIRLKVASDKLCLFQVTSQWELLISKCENETCLIISPQLPLITCFVDSLPLLKRKLTYATNVILPSVSSSSCIVSALSEEVTSKDSDGTMQVSLDSSCARVEDNAITDEDIQQITNTLSNLQALAVEVKREQETQLEAIDTLITDVEKTELRVKSDNKKIKKAM